MMRREWAIHRLQYSDEVSWRAIMRHRLVASFLHSCQDQAMPASNRDRTSNWEFATAACLQ